jgi:WD40 repeat protein
MAGELCRRLVDLGVHARCVDTAALDSGACFDEPSSDAAEAVRFVPIVTPQSVASDAFRSAWRRARREGQAVLPVIGRRGVSIASLPWWMVTPTWFDLGMQAEAFLQSLCNDAPQPAVPMMAAPLAAMHIDRPEETQRLKDLLLGCHEPAPVAITPVAQTVGGFGLTTIARAFCADADVRAAFGDGILWTALGRSPSRTDLLNRVIDLVEAMSGDVARCDTLESAATHLRECLQDLDVLLVIDDVWRESDLVPFLRGLQCCKGILITTRFPRLLQAEVRRLSVPRMRLELARGLLAWGLPVDAAEMAAAEETLDGLVQRLGREPTLVRLANAWLRSHAACGAQRLGAAVGALPAVLSEAGLASFDADDPRGRDDALMHMVAHMVDGLDAIDRERFLCLSLLDPMRPIRIDVLERLWKAFDPTHDRAAARTCRALVDASLLETYGTDGTAFAHSVDVHQWMIRRLGAKGLEHRHGLLLAAHRDCPTALQDSEWRCGLAKRLAGAGRIDELRAMLWNPDWLFGDSDPAGRSPGAAPVRRFRSAVEVHRLADCYDLIAGDDELRRVGRALRASTRVLLRDPAQLPSQLFGRLGTERSPALRALCSHAMARISAEPLVPILPALAGVDVQTLRLHGMQAAYVGGSCSILAGGTRALLCTDDYAVRLWDIPNGALLLTLKGDQHPILGATLLPGEDRVLSWSSAEEALRLWDLHTGEALWIAAGSEDGIAGALAMPEAGRVVSWSKDGALDLWDLERGALIRRLGGHSGGVVGATALRGSRALSWGKDGSLLIWDLTNGELQHALVAHGSEVKGVAVCADGQYALSWDKVGQLNAWDLQTGALIRQVGDGADHFLGAALFGDGRRVLSWCDKGVLRIWGLPDGVMLRESAARAGTLTNVTLVDGDRRAVALSAADGSVGVWDLEQASLDGMTRSHAGWCLGACVVAEYGSLKLCSGIGGALHLWDACETSQPARAKHDQAVTSVATMADGRRAMSWSADQTIRVWSLHDGGLLNTLHGHDALIIGCELLPGCERALSWSEDGGLLLWDVSSGKLLHSLKGHRLPVVGAQAYSGGRHALSWSSDGTLRCWDLTRGSALQLMRGHRSAVNGARVLADQHRALSWSADRTVRVWDLRTGVLISVLKGHRDSVAGAMPLADPDRALSWGDDGTLRLWDVPSGRQLSVLRGDGQRVEGVALLPAAHRVLSWDRGGALRLWDLREGGLEHRLDGHDGCVHGAAVLDAGRRAVSWGADHAIRLWDLQARRELSTFRGHEGPIYGVQRADERHLVSWSGDGTVRWWCSDSGDCIQTCWSDEAINAGVLAHSARRILAFDLSGRPQLLSYPACASHA